MATESTRLRKALGLRRREAERLDEALTHGSVNEVRKMAARTQDRLAFLGDAVIHMVVRQGLFDAMDVDKGQLTEAADKRERAAEQAASARRLGFSSFIRTGAGSKGAAHQETVLATTLEAIVGAVFVSRGYRKTRKWLLRVLPELGPGDQ